MKPVIRSNHNRFKDNEKDVLDIINEQKDHEKSKSRDEDAYFKDQQEMDGIANMNNSI